MSHDTRAPTTWNLIKIPALVTLIVTVVRLVGELVGGPESLFSTEAGGRFALLGITWLVPLFGLWFGARLATSSRAPSRRGIAFFWSLAAVVVLAGGLALAIGVVKAEYPTLLVWVGGVGIAAILTAAKAWGSLAWTNLVYGLAARIPIVLITMLAFAMEWDTHHVKTAPGTELDTADAEFLLWMFQLVFWVPFTVVIGGLFGSIGAFLRTRGAD